MDENPHHESLSDLRRRIDELDAELVRIVSKRAAVVVEIGKTKRVEGTPIYARTARRRCWRGCLPTTPAR